jgi:hypothetical protein
VAAGVRAGRPNVTPKVCRWHNGKSDKDVKRVT